MKSKNIEYQEKIDHVRFFAAVLIVMFHAIHGHFAWKPLGSDEIHAPPVFALLLEGQTAVALFMTLSGFLFAMIGKDREVNIWDFYRNRFLRIYPLFIVSVLLALYLDSARNQLPNLISSLLLFQNQPWAVQVKWFTEASWTIAVECQFYLIFPFLLAFFRRYGYKYLIGLTILAMLARLAIYLSNSSVYEIATSTIFGRIDQFLIGMIFGFAFQRIKGALSHPLILISTLGMLLFGASYYHAIGGRKILANSSIWIYLPTIEGLVWAIVISAYLASVWGLPKRISKILAFGGTLSFSMYLMQMFVLRLSKWFIMQIWFPDPKNALFYSLLCNFRIHPFSAAVFFGACIVLPVLICASILTYFLIEKPFLDLRVPYLKKGKLDDGSTEAASMFLSEIASEESGLAYPHSQEKRA